MIGVFIYLSPLFDFSPADSTAGNDPDRQVQPRVDTDTDNGDYEFYDILPNQEMATIPDEDIADTGNDRIGDISAFEPDVVVTQPEDGSASRNDDTGNFGISENTVIAPSRGNNAATSNSGDDIVIVEEDATYDDRRLLVAIIRLPIMQAQVLLAFRLQNLRQLIFCRSTASVMRMKQIAAVLKC